MPIPLTYLPSTVIDRAAGPTEDEEKALQSAKANLREPVDFDFSGAYEMLRDRGYDNRTAMDTIAFKLGEKNNFDVQAAREAGFTTESIVAKLIGRDPDDLEAAPVGTFVGGLGRGFVSNLPAGAAGTATALGWGAAGLREGDPDGCNIPLPALQEPHGRHRDRDARFFASTLARTLRRRDLYRAPGS